MMYLTPTKPIDLLTMNFTSRVDMSNLDSTEDDVIDYVFNIDSEYAYADDKQKYKTRISISYSHLFEDSIYIEYRECSMDKNIDDANIIAEFGIKGWKQIEAFTTMIDKIRKTINK